MSHNITVEGGKSVKLKTAGKYCDRDIVVTAEGGSGMVVCEEKAPLKSNTIDTIYDLKISYPSATVIGDRAFLSCKSLASIELPNVTSIGNSAFYDCTSLTSIHLPNVTSISNTLFSGCTSLASIDLPNVTSIGHGAFSECTNLSTVILRTTEQPCILDVTSFLETKIMDENGMLTGQGFVYYPTSMDEAYRAVYEPAFAEMGMPGAFDYLFRKIEDYPDICGG